MSIELQNEQGESFTHNIFANGHIKFARFMVGTMTVEIYSAQDVNSANSPSVQNIGQNTGTTTMVFGAGTSQPVAPPSFLLAGQNYSTSSSQIIESIHGTETAQNRTVSMHRTETKERTVSTRPGNEGTQNQKNIEEEEEEEKEYRKSMTGWLMTVATLLMGMAFQSGLNVPGGTWSDTKTNSSSTSIGSTDNTTHTAGLPIIRNIDPTRYHLFVAFNIVAFAFSMSVIVLLLFKKFPKHSLLSIRSLLLYTMGIIAMVYALGCATNLVYAEFIVALVLVCVVYFVVSHLVHSSWNAPPVKLIRSLSGKVQRHFSNIR